MNGDFFTPLPMNLPTRHVLPRSSASSDLRYENLCRRDNYLRCLIPLLECLDGLERQLDQPAWMLGSSWMRASYRAGLNVTERGMEVAGVEPSLD
jgi:hypothetical protein